LLLIDALTVEPLLLAQVVLAHHHLAEGGLAAVTVGRLVLLELLFLQSADVAEGAPGAFLASSLPQQRLSVGVQVELVGLLQLLAHTVQLHLHSFRRLVDEVVEGPSNLHLSPTSCYFLIGQPDDVLVQLHNLPILLLELLSRPIVDLLASSLSEPLEEVPLLLSHFLLLSLYLLIEVLNGAEVAAGERRKRVEPSYTVVQVRHQSIYKRQRAGCTLVGGRFGWPQNSTESF